MKRKKVIESSQHGFAKGKSHFTNLITFYNKVTNLLDEARAADAVYLIISKADTIISS